MQSLDESEMIYYPLKRNTCVKLNITIESHKLNNKIIENLFITIKNRFENKCTENGYINKIHGIIKFSVLPFLNENTKAINRFETHINCDLITPLVEQLLVCTIIKFYPDILRVQHGPIEVICRINNEIFQLLSKSYSKNVLIKIDDIKYALFDVNIKCIGAFQRILDDDEYNDYKFNT